MEHAEKLQFDIIKDVMEMFARYSVHTPTIARGTQQGLAQWKRCDSITPEACVAAMTSNVKHTILLNTAYL